MRRMQAQHVLASVVVLLCTGLLGTPSAHAEGSTSFGIGSFTTSLSTTQAGGHPDVTTTITQANEALGNPVQQLKDVHIQLPPGLIGDPRAAPQCTARQFQRDSCPLDTQVGVIEPLFIIVCRGVSTALGAGTEGQVPPTVLTEPVSLGAGTLTVESTAGIQPGDILTIGDGESTAEATVSAVTDPTHLELSSSINTNFTAGVPVADNALGVASTAGFCAGEHDKITVGTGSSAETAAISFVASPTRLMLQTPLTQHHAAGEPVSHLAETQTAPFPLYNLEPTPGHLATLGMSFLVGSIFVQLDVRDDGSDGLEASITDLSTLFSLDGSSFTLWGVPADSSHDSERCTLLTHECGPATAEAKSFVTAPTQCSQPLTATVSIDSWQNPGHFVTTSSTAPTPTGCGRLQIEPTLTVTPDTVQADTPAGYTIALSLPQSKDAFGLATPALKTVAITLPVGASLSPAGTAGLQGCARVLFDAGKCPGRSTLGTASISSPASPSPLEGGVYLATPEPGAPYGIFLIASAEGISVRLEGRIRADPSTGQLTITFENSPQLPLSELRASFFGGPVAPLANPAICGNAITTSQISSYSGQAAEPSSSFLVAANNQGTACSSGRQFHPHFSAGMTSPLAGAFSPFTLTVAREDQEQDLSTIITQLPPGLLGQFARVPLCAEPQAGEGRCSTASAVGSVQVGVGAGTDPLYLSGTVHLTGPYAGAPFGLSIVVPAAAGPFNLGTIVLRATVSVDPRDLHLTVVTDPIPQIVAGIPLRIRAVDLVLDRADFLLNPTNCGEQSVSGILGSIEGANAAVSTPFAIAGCSGLRFSPELTASQHATTSAGGADLDVTIAAGTERQAHIRSVTMTLPRQMRPRLVAIQHACRAVVFSSSPTRCPSGSVIGQSVMSTPLLSAPLEGSLYLVSRGGSSLPVMAAMLSSRGIKVSLEGQLRLSNNGATTVTFPALPDVPISSVKISLPRGRSSALGAVHSLCSGVRPNIAYRLTAQNGARQIRTIGVTVKGCSRGRRIVRPWRQASRRGRSQGRRALPRT